MARNTLSRAERYHPKGKKTNYNKTVSFLLQFPPALCVSRESPLTDPLAKNLAGMRGRSGSKVCFVFLLSLVGNFQKRAKIQNLVSKYRAYAKRQWQSQNTNEQTKQTKKNIQKQRLILAISTNHYERVEQSYWYCEQLQTIAQVSTKTGRDKPLQHPRRPRA